MKKILLFTSDTCASCPGVKLRLDAAQITYEPVNISKDPRLAIKYGVKGVPLVLVLDDDGTPSAQFSASVRVADLKEAAA